MSTPEQKHPLVQALVDILPNREARFDFMRAYDSGIQDSIKALEAALKLHTVMPFGWIVRRTYLDGQERKHLYMRNDGEDWRDDQIGRFWTDTRIAAEIFPTEFMLTAMEKLKVMFPYETMEAVELFTAV